MKKVIYLLVLCMVLGMAGCGTNQENKEPVSGNVSVETENKENDDVVQNEQIADTGSYPPCVMVDGVIYKDTGYVASMPGCGTMDEKLCQQWQGQSYHLKIINQISEADIIIKGVLKVSS